MPAPKGVYRASDRALGMGEMGRANGTNRSNRGNRSNNKGCEGCTYIQYHMRRELSVAVACSLWLDRWGLGRAGVGLVGGVRGGALGRDGGEAILIRRRKSTFVDIFKGNGKEISRPPTRSKL